MILLITLPTRDTRGMHTGSDPPRPAERATEIQTVPAFHGLSPLELITHKAEDLLGVQI